MWQFPRSSCCSFSMLCQSSIYFNSPSRTGCLGVYPVPWVNAFTWCRPCLAGHKLAPGLLLAGKERLTSELEMFTHAQGIDLVNEKRPEEAGKANAPTDFREGLSDGEVSP